MRIGFLALSGLRAHDPELLRLGMSLPGIIERGKVVGSLPSLGLLYLAAVTPAGHELRYFEAEGDGKEPADLWDCDLVAISTFSAQVFEAYAIADRLRNRGILVAMGGLHVSVCPEEAAEHADFVFIGEGEKTWPAAIRAIESGARSGIFRARDFEPVDVANLPIPPFELLANRPYRRFTIQTSRGCPFRCEFCASNIMLQERYRKRPVDQVRRDIEALLKIRRRPFIEFADDNTFVDKEWGKELCRQLIPLRLNWFTETDISVADDDELLELMAKSRCRQVLIGLESPEPISLHGIELKTNFKARQFSKYHEAIRRIQDFGITVNGCFILGLEEHTPAIFDQVFEFANSAGLYEVQLTVLTPFPGTPLYDRLAREGRLLFPNRWDRCTLFDVNFVPRGMSPEELRQGLYNLTARLFEPAAVASRREKYFARQYQLHGHLAPN